jgi:hypothetical protein
MKTHLKIVLIGILLPLFLISCSQSPVGIFASIAREQRVLDERELENTLTVSDMAKAGGKYFISAGLLYYRDIDYGASELSQWQAISAPGSADDNYVTNSVVAFNGSIYATFTHQDGSPSGIYRIDVGANPPAIDGTQVFGTDTDGIESVGKLFVVDDGTPRLLVSAKTDAALVSHSLYASDDGSSFAEITGTAAGTPWIDVADNSSGAELLYVSPAKVLIDGDGIATSGGIVTSDTGKAGSAAFTGAHFDAAASRLWLADDSGHLYSSPDFGSNWSRNADAYRYENESDNEVVEFTDIQSVGTGSDRITVVGTRELGYYVLGSDALTAPQSPGPVAANYRESDLSDTAVIGFFTDSHSSGDYLFALSAASGLWRGKVDSDPIVWIQE